MVDFAKEILGRVTNREGSTTGVASVYRGQSSFLEMGKDTFFDKLPKDPALQAGAVDVWMASVAGAADWITKLRRTLSPNELRRSERFFFERDRLRYVVSHGLLRSILGRYMGADPSDLRFAAGTHGKPSLDGPHGGHGVTFNLSHSGDLVLVAIASHCRIGVDIEYVRADFDWKPIAVRFFASGEVETLECLPPDAGREGFFLYWTVKEAYMKALGRGLTLPPGSFEVSALPPEPPVLISDGAAPAGAARWTFHRLDPGPGYAAALAAEGGSVRVRLRSLLGPADRHGTDLECR